MEEADAKLADRPLPAPDGSSARPVNPPSLGKPNRWRRRFTLAGLLAVLLAAGLVLPGMVDIAHYRRQIAGLMSRSMGRPVRMSGVELRLLPTPGFVLHDLAVSEDPHFGAEPILSARTVVASIRILSLLRGHIAISRVSVDEASLNLVRSADGRWNLEALMMGTPPGNAAEPQTAPHIPGTSSRFPYLEATDSRVNLKNGDVKSPFSIEDTDLSLWQDSPGQWRVRLRGQPMRTDIPMDLADTGEVRLEAALQSAAQLRDLPLKLDLEWRNAQLGQLSRLLTGSDAGWRGDLTLDVDVQGTPESAQTTARLRATGVRREEFAPETPLDFDANCAFRYQHSANAAHDVTCNTAIGDGQLHLKAELPGKSGPPEAMLEVDNVPLQAGLDLLRTVRSGLAPGIGVKGAVSGTLTYHRMAPAANLAPRASHRSGKRPPIRKPAAQPQPTGDLRGTLTVDGARFSGGSLSEPLELPQIILTPALSPSGTSELAAQFTLPLAAPATRTEKPEAASMQLELSTQGYRAAAAGTAGIAKLRGLAYGFGWPRLDAADNFSSGTADFSIAAQGPWIAPENAAGLLDPAASVAPDTMDGTLTLHHAEWRAGYLARPAELPQGTAAFDSTGIDFNGEFSYGNGRGAAKEQVRGAIAVHAVTDCVAASLGSGAASGSPEPCLPQVRIRFGALDAKALESALLGAPEEKSLLASLMDRMRAPDRPKWPAVALEVGADTLTLGPATLEKPEAQVRFEQGVAVMKHWEAGLLGGTAEGTGRLGWADDRPQYALDGTFRQVNAGPLSALLGRHWTGGPVSGEGKVQISGRAAAELAGSASGTVHFDWRHGGGLEAGEPSAIAFDDWSGTASIEGKVLRLSENTLVARGRTLSLAGEIPFSETATGAAGLTVAPAPTHAAAK